MAQLHSCAINIKLASCFFSRLHNAKSPYYYLWERSMLHLHTNIRIRERKLVNNFVLHWMQSIYELTRTTKTSACIGCTKYTQGTHNGQTTESLLRCSPTHIWTVGSNFINHAHLSGYMPTSLRDGISNFYIYIQDMHTHASHPRVTTSL